MYKLIYIALFTAAIVLSGCSSGGHSVPQAQPSPVVDAIVTDIPEKTESPITAPVPAPQASAIPVPVTPVPTAVPASVPSIVPAAAPTAAPTAKPQEKKTVKITKSPTDETVDEGGKAIFIAKAENAEKAVWILVSPDAKTTYTLEQGPSAFPGLAVEGQGTEKIHIYNIPYAMNGWRVQCYFEGNGGPLYTGGAYLTVKKAQEQSPAIYIADKNEQRGYQDAVNFSSNVRRYADYIHFSSGGVENYKYYEDSKYGEFRMAMTRGAVTLMCTLRTYPDDSSVIPESLVWYESEQVQNTYSFGKNDPEAWNHLEKTMLDIAGYYGGGTAGESMR